MAAETAINRTMLDALEKRRLDGSLRRLPKPSPLIDFCSNDYLGLAKVQERFGPLNRGSGASRLLSGNTSEAEDLEKVIADFHESESALLYNSGYNANLGLISCLAGRQDLVLYDELCHASIRDGVRLSLAKKFSYNHNCMDDLAKKLTNAKRRYRPKSIFVLSESIFSMDGDFAPLKVLSSLCELHKAHLILDEAHTTGVFGQDGRGLSNELGVAHTIFARIYTFGKAFGCHGAAVAGSALLKNYLLNFSRPFIYSTTLPPLSIASIRWAYDQMPKQGQSRSQLFSLIKLFSQLAAEFRLDSVVPQAGPVQSILVPGNFKALCLAQSLQNKGFDLRAILSPTVKKGQERIRLSLHSFNTASELRQLLQHLTDSIRELE